jgi:Protein of unknown function (DUF2975)
MRKLQILKALLNLFWFFSMLAIVLMLVFIPFMFFKDAILKDIPIKINGEKLLIVDFTTKIILVFEIFAFAIFAFGIYKLRKLLNLFQKKIIFEFENIQLLNQIGICFLATSVFSGIPMIAYQIKYKNINFEIGGSFNSFLFSASLGLFFMVLSEVFKLAKKSKEENELTI